VITKSILLIILIISFQGCATWLGIKKDSKEVWDVTTDTSKKVYNSAKKSINEATSD
jgi:hypothetical protein